MKSLQFITQLIWNILSNYFQSLQIYWQNKKGISSIGTQCSCTKQVNSCKQLFIFEEGNIMVEHVWPSIPSIPSIYGQTCSTCLCFCNWMIFTSPVGHNIRFMGIHLQLYVNDTRFFILSPSSQYDSIGCLQHDWFCVLLNLALNPNKIESYLPYNSA